MASLRKQFAELKQVESARDALLEQLLNTIDDAQKTTRQNELYVVLIDGNHLRFPGKAVIEGTAAGVRAVDQFRKAVLDHLSSQGESRREPTIIVRIYVNVERLSKSYAAEGVLHNVTLLHQFIQGFNDSHPLCEMIESTNEIGRYNTKIEGNFRYYAQNAQCKQVYLGASIDTVQACLFSSLDIDTNVLSLTTVLIWPHFSANFELLSPNIRRTEFKNMFSGDDGIAHAVRHNNDVVHQQEQHYGQPDFFSPSHTGSSSSQPQRDRQSGLASYTNKTVGDNSPRSSARHTLTNGDQYNSSQDWNGWKEDNFKLPAVSQSSHGLNLSPDIWNEPSSSKATDIADRPKTADVEAALISSVTDLLKDNPRHLDSGVVKRKVEHILGLTPDFWGTGEKDEWFMKHKKIIRMTVENWVEQTNSYPPKNCIWMMTYFKASNEPPSTIMRSPSAALWRTHVDLSCDLPSVSQNSKEVHSIGEKGLHRNAKGQRIDLPTDLKADAAEVQKLRTREPRLCNAYHLADNCANLSCPHDHDAMLSKPELEALQYLSRSQRCMRGSNCSSEDCIKGHICPDGKYCRRGNKCRFISVHGIDTTIVNGMQSNSAANVW